MIEVVEIIRKSQLIDQSNGNYTVTMIDVAGLTREDGSPSQVGDVLSIQPDGTIQTRPPGTAAAFEICQISSKGLVYKPVDRSFLVSYVD